MSTRVDTEIEPQKEIYGVKEDLEFYSLNKLF